MSERSERPMGAARVTRAVLPAAGFGTRFLPATKAFPKELLPVLDKPAIQYVVEEAAGAGIDDVLVVTGRGKAALEDHFDRAPELEADLEAKGKTDALAAVRAATALARVHFVRQGEALGLGHAVSVARDHVGDAPFAVLLPDELMVDDSAVLRALVAVAEEREASVVALKEVTVAEIVSLGAARVEAVDGAPDELVRIRGVVEKPPADEVPSNLALTGRYVFTPRIFECLERVAPGAGGEIQLTDAIGLLLEEEPVYGWVYREGRHDVGKPFEHLKAVVELALQRPDMAGPFRAFLADAVCRYGIT